jgi:hypothetical protein
LPRLVLAFALALLALPATAIAQKAKPTAEPAVVTAWNVKAAKPDPQPRLRIATEGDRAEAIAEHLKIRSRDQWVSNEGFRFTGNKIAYKQRF